MKVYLIVVLGCVSFAGFAQQKDDLSNLQSYQHTVNYADHKAVFQVAASSLQPQSVNPNVSYYWYSNNKLNVTQGGYSGRLLNGKYSEFYHTIGLRSQGIFGFGLKTGRWDKWSLAGLLIEQANFKGGILHGDFLSYDTTGKLTEWGRYRRGNRSGKWTRRIAADSLVSVRYRNGKVVRQKDSFFRKLFRKDKPTVNPLN